MNNPLRSSLRRLLPQRFGQPTLKQRRRNRVLRHLVISLLIGLAVFAALESATSFVATTPIIVAKHAIARGEPITRDDIKMLKVTGNRPFSQAASAAADVVDQVPLVDIASGDPVLNSMITPAPTLPEHHTIIDVRLYGEQAHVVTGATVSLVVASQQDCPVQPSLEQSSPEQSPDSRLCVLAAEAIAMPQAKQSSPSDSHRRFAMSQDDAAHVMQAQDVADILAVVSLVQ